MNIRVPAGLVGLFAGLTVAGPLAAEDTPPAPVEAVAPAEAGLPPGADPIGDVLSGVAASEGMDEEEEAPQAPQQTAPRPLSPAMVDAATSEASGDASEPALLAAPPSPAPRQPAIITPPPTAYVPPTSRLPALDRPVMIDEIGRSPEAPPTAAEQAYENRIKGGVSSAQGMQGPLDGAWMVRSSDGRPLYVLQLVDKGSSGRPVEGAWRSVRPDGPPGQVGLVEAIDRTPEGLFIRFTPRGASAPVVLTLTQQGPAWTGEIWDKGATRPVQMRRN